MAVFWDLERRVVDEAGLIQSERYDAVSTLAGLRYLSRAETT